MNRTKNLSDAYRKDTGGNLYKLLQLINLLQNDTKIDLNAIDSSRDIHEATGKTLDGYGLLIGESRNGATDEQYRTKILSKIARYRTDSDCNSIITAIAQLFTTDAANLSIIEDDMKADVIGLTISMLEKSGYKSREIKSVLSELMPVGVELIPPKYAGTLKLLSDEEIQKYALFKERYPVLFPAWQENFYVNFGGDDAGIYTHDIGLSGYGEVPEEWKGWGSMYWYSGTFEGGTLGLLTGEDE